MNPPNTIKTVNTAKKTDSFDNTSQCSCEKCDTLRCLAVKNKKHCILKCPNCDDTIMCIYKSELADKSDTRFTSPKKQPVSAPEFGFNTIKIIKESKVKEDNKNSLCETENAPCKYKSYGKPIYVGNVKAKMIENISSLLDKIKETSGMIEDTNTELVENEVNLEGQPIKNENNNEIDNISLVNMIIDTPGKIEDTNIETVDNKVININNEIKNKLDETGEYMETAPAFESKFLAPNTAELSAQIMNLPYKDFKETITLRKLETPSNPVKLTKYDIIKRIKDAYKACSCKVCECIGGKGVITSNYTCTCKPCECVECTTLKQSLKYKKLDPSKDGCPCVRCDRKDCKSLTKKSDNISQPCDCDDIKNLDNFNNPCNCKPCECIECKSYLDDKPKCLRSHPMGEDIQCRGCQCAPCECLEYGQSNDRFSVNKPFLAAKPIKVIAASMRVDTPRPHCECNPCECGLCGQDFPAVSGFRHQMSTGMSRPANCLCDSCNSESCEAGQTDLCSCQVQNFMRKSFDKDKFDYDIHRASIEYKIKNNKF